MPCVADGLAGVLEGEDDSVKMKLLSPLLCLCSASGTECSRHCRTDKRLG